MRRIHRHNRTAVLAPGASGLLSAGCQGMVQQLRLLRDRRRGGPEYVHLMHAFASRLTDSQIREVAQYYASAAP